MSEKKKSIYIHKKRTDPFVMRLMQALVNPWDMEPAVNPINTEVCEYKEPKRKRGHMSKATRCFLRMPKAYQTVEKSMYPQPYFPTSL